MNRKIAGAAIFIAAAFLPLEAEHYGGNYGGQHLVQAGHWVYDALNTIALDCGSVSMASNAPLTVSELRLCLINVPYEELSSSGRVLYDKVKEFLTNEARAADMGLLKMGVNIDAAPTMMMKSNDDIDWSYGAEKRVNSKEGVLPQYSKSDLAVRKPIDSEAGLIVTPSSYRYGDAGGFYGNDLTRPFAEIKFFVFSGDYLTMEADPCLANSYWGAVDNGNIINFPKNYDMIEFYWPMNVYASAGIWREKEDYREGAEGKSTAAGGTRGVGVNINIARQGLEIGRTTMGSVIVNSTFQTDMCAQFSIYSSKFRYNMDLAQMGRERYIYLHCFEGKPFKWLRFTLMEGTLIDSPFELKFLNPFMIMHSFGIWQFGEYDKTPLDEDIYGESHVSAYLAFNFDIVPCRNVRIYGLYSQNELQLPWELRSDNGKAFPNSFAGQLGVEVIAADNHDGYWHWSIEGIYTSPWCYLKQEKTGSLVSYRHDMQSDNSTDIYSWIGSPYGPDTLGFNLRALYEKEKWKVSCDYLFTARGTASFGLFGNYMEINGEKYYMYYPAVRYKMYDRFGNSDFGLNASEAKDLAQTYSLTGTIEYRNTLTLKGVYRINDHFEAGGKASCVIVFNNNHEGAATECGVEAAASLKWTLF